MPKIVVVCQYDDMGLYVDGVYVMGGDCKVVNGAIDILQAIGYPVTHEGIDYDIWSTKHQRWPKYLRMVKGRKGALS